MRTNLDFAPFFRSTVGFDRLFDLLENNSRLTTATNWPAYNIVRAGEDGYRISLAVPGFSSDELEITQQPNMLVVSGNKSAEDGELLHRGIPAGSFTHRFELADYVDVIDARLSDGLLTIELKREVPETLKPKKITIGSAGGDTANKQIESKAA
ncbi:MAG TPA: Hsp20 family protein [Devosia sp.]|jgi:molecular chaperone IbpA|nr:Hsp20 family protein [Devosia sp.]